MKSITIIFKWPKAKSINHSFMKSDKTNYIYIYTHTSICKYLIKSHTFMEIIFTLIKISRHWKWIMMQMITIRKIIKHLIYIKYFLNFFFIKYFVSFSLLNYWFACSKKEKKEKWIIMPLPQCNHTFYPAAYEFLMMGKSWQSIPVIFMDSY